MISGPSGSGKTTLARIILDSFDSFSFSVSATTRKKRENETDGIDYYFLNKKDFTAKISQNELLEYQEVYPGLYYGTLKSEIDRINSIHKVALLDVDVKGAMNIKKIYSGEAFTIFVHPGSIEILENRLKERKSEDAAGLAERLKRSVSELDYAPEFDAIVANSGSLENAVSEMKKILSKLHIPA